MSEVVITAIGRTPIGRAIKGSLIDQRPDDLGAFIADEVLKQVPQLDRRQIDDVICGCALPGGEQGHNLARIISILAGVGAPGTTVNRYCASSLQAVRMAFHAIKADEGSAFLCVGVESSTRSPLGVFSDQPETQNPRLFSGNSEGFPDAYMAMGLTAENVADTYDITREEMDQYALQSHMRAVLAAKDGIFAREIIPVPLASGITAIEDDGPRADTTLEKLATLRTVFRKNGRVTAGNCYRTTQMVSGRSEFVLCSSGHIQTVVADPEHRGLGYYLNPETPSDAGRWLAGAQRREGSWWEHWADWLAARSGKQAEAPESFGSQRFPALEAAPGSYVRQ